MSHYNGYFIEVKKVLVSGEFTIWNIYRNMNSVKRCGYMFVCNKTDKIERVRFLGGNNA